MSFAASPLARYQAAGGNAGFVYRTRPPIADWQDPALNMELKQRTTTTTTRISTGGEDEEEDDFEDQGPVLRSAIAALNAQAQLISAVIDEDEAAGNGPSARTQGLLNSYQAQGAVLQRQVQAFQRKTCPTAWLLCFLLLLCHHAYLSVLSPPPVRATATLLTPFACATVDWLETRRDDSAASPLEDPDVMMTQVQALEKQGQRLLTKANKVPRKTGDAESCGERFNLLISCCGSLVLMRLVADSLRCALQNCLRP